MISIALAAFLSLSAFTARTVACDVPAHIDHARSLLSSVTPALGDGTSREAPEKEFALAVLRKDTCETEVIYIRKEGEALISPEGWDIEPIQRVNGIRWNNWNTEFYVRSPANAVVIGNVEPFNRSESIGRRIKTIAGIFKVIWNTVRSVDYRYYVPYSRELHTSEMVDAGQDYLSALASGAMDDLRKKGIRSHAFPDRLVADLEFLTPEMFERLPVIEHADLLEFIFEPERTTERVLVLLGANKTQAFGYTYNSAGAYGLMQFTDNGLNGGTYTTIRKRYPSAELIPTFPDGAWDHRNAMKAAILLHDNNLKLLVDTFGEAIVQDPRLEEFLAALYNASPVRVVAAMKESNRQGGPDWSAYLPDRIKLETGGYIVKLRYLQKQDQDLE